MSKLTTDSPSMNVCPATGITILRDPMPGARTVSIGLYIRSGAAQEKASEAGISHFLEHLVFKGIVKDGKEITEAMADLGSHANAYTTDEHTSFYATCLPEVANETLELLLQVLNPKFTAQDVEVERRVILEEMRQYRDDPSYVAHEKGLRFFAPRHPLARPIIGTAAVLSSLTPESIVQFLYSRYRPGRIALSIAGDLSCCTPESLLDSQLKRFGDAKSLVSSEKNNVKGGEKSSAPLKMRRGVQRLSKRGIQTSHLVAFWPALSEHEPGKFALELWCDIVGSGSRLAWQLIEPGIVDGAGLSCEPRIDTGYVMLSAEGSPERMPDVENQLSSILKEMLSSPVTDEELEQSKAMTLFSLATGDEAPTDRMTANGNHWITHAALYPHVAERAAFAAVTTAEVNQFNAAFQWQDAAITVVAPE